LQQIRDEAHRFAITYHRQRRAKRMTKSALDGIPGLGPVRRKKLLKVFGSVKRMREASMEELASVSSIPKGVAENLYRSLRGEETTQTTPGQAGRPGANEREAS
jgi:excinuclease ABC subunit C